MRHERRRPVTLHWRASTSCIEASERLFPDRAGRQAAQSEGRYLLLQGRPWRFYGAPCFKRQPVQRHWRVVWSLLEHRVQGVRDDEFALHDWWESSFHAGKTRRRLPASIRSKVSISKFFRRRNIQRSCRRPVPFGLLPVFMNTGVFLTDAESSCRAHDSLSLMVLGEILPPRAGDRPRITEP